jgi:hypothetical protein
VTTSEFQAEWIARAQTNIKACLNLGANNLISLSKAGRKRSIAHAFPPPQKYCTHPSMNHHGDSMALFPNSQRPTAACCEKIVPSSESSCIVMLPLTLQTRQEAGRVVEGGCAGFVGCARKISYYYYNEKWNTLDNCDGQEHERAFLT